jgi:hypothetical protein
VKSKINTNKSTPQNPVYKYDDDAGEFPVSDFNKDINIFDQIPGVNDPSIEINQPFISAFTDESVVSPVTEKKLTKAQQKKLDKGQTPATPVVRTQPPAPPSPKLQDLIIHNLTNTQAV